MESKKYENDKKNELSKPKIVSIIPVWNEQQMIGLSIASTKDIVYQYIVLIKKSTDDKTREVLEYCKKLWNLNMIIIESDLKLRDRRKYAVEISRKYADYYLIQDADEIYFNNSASHLKNDTNAILQLIKDGYTFCYACIIFLEKDLLHVPKDENQLWLIPHPFLFKNTPDIFWPNTGDMPSCNAGLVYHKIFNTGERTIPFKFDCKIKDFKRIFLREVFTPWHDTNFLGTIEDFADKYHHTVIWYRKNIDTKLTLLQIIDLYEKHLNKNEDEKYKWHKLYEPSEYIEYPEVIQKFIDFNKIEGIKDINDLIYLDKL